MTRMVRALSAIAVAAAALGVLVGTGEPSWESTQKYAVTADPGEPSWESEPARSVLAAPSEPSWEFAPTQEHPDRVSVEAGAGA
ncbi:hypothetical protein EAO71_19725 [Streptomyces sp. ms191]|uniref:hypothetical protein n=1 Tax=unclassified Streptomyces TaxID=2593676 RepID=UPI0011CEA163|nr:hypothetical protein [Streptomyces sp. ms191]TXS30646.1 hypothetical protein EAO71_19725 [Streptomyces sp. ms191]